MGLLVPGPSANESILWKRGATYIGDPRRGGLILLTRSAFVFRPTRLDYLAGAREWSLDRKQIASVEGVPPERTYETLTHGGWRNRLQVTSTSGERFTFVIRRPDRGVRELIASLSGESGESV
jgi:hypothetical protein